LTINSTSSDRSATINVAGQMVTVTQAAKNGRPKAPEQLRVVSPVPTTN
jgi:hypothetical protein